MVPLRYSFFPDCLLEVGAQCEFGVLGHISSLLDLVDFASNYGIDDLVGACGQVIAGFGGEFGAHL